MNGFDLAQQTPLGHETQNVNFAIDPLRNCQHGFVKGAACQGEFLLEATDEFKCHADDLMSDKSYYVNCDFYAGVAFLSCVCIPRCLYTTWAPPALSPFDIASSCV